MIAQLTGVVARSEANSIILDVGGVGYQVFVPVTVLEALPEAGAKFTLATHLIVREDEMTLYGFANAGELQAFKLLLGVSGVGPKVALALLSAMDVASIARALSTNDTRVITKVPGVGPKLAQRLCLELGDKMAVFAFEQRTERAEAGRKTEEENAAYEDTIEAMIGFGYSRADARRAADRVFANAPDRTNTAALISEALKALTGGKR